MQNESSEQDSSEEEGSNQLLDRLDDPKVREAVLEQARDADYCLAKQGRRGFSLLIIKESEPDSYQLKEYNLVFLGPQGLMSKEKSSLNIGRTNSGAQAAMPASSALSGLTKEDVEEKVKEYEEEGFAVFK